MLDLLLLIGVILAFFVIRKFLQERGEEKLRDNPPERRIIQVSLPNGIKDSRTQMRRFWKKVAKAVETDASGRKAGRGQIDLVYYVTVPGPKASPVINCLIYADPDKMDAVKRAVKQVFDAQSDVLELDHDPLAEPAALINQEKHQDRDPEMVG